MNQFITFREPDDNGLVQYYILQREHPHYVGVIENVPRATIVNAPISGYYLWVVFAGTLRGNMIPAFPDVYKEMESVFTAMAEWYFVNRVSVNPKKFKKWKIE